MRLRAKQVRVRREVEQWTGRSRRAAAEGRVVGRCIVVAQHESGVSRQVSVDSTEYVGQRILLEDASAATWVGQTLRFGVVLERCYVRRSRDTIRRSEE